MFSEMFFVSYYSRTRRRNTVCLFKHYLICRYFFQYANFILILCPVRLGILGKSLGGKKKVVFLTRNPPKPIKLTTEYRVRGPSLYTNVMSVTRVVIIRKRIIWLRWKTWRDCAVSFDGFQGRQTNLKMHTRRPSLDFPHNTTEVYLERTSKQALSNSGGAFSFPPFLG